MSASGSPGRTRTSDPAVNSRLLYRLSYRGTCERLRRRIALSYHKRDSAQAHFPQFANAPRLRRARRSNGIRLREGAKRA